jgi:hypothetical protein
MSGEANAVGPTPPPIKMGFYTFGAIHEVPDSGGETGSDWFQQRLQSLAVPDSYIKGVQYVSDATAYLKTLDPSVQIGRLYFDGHGNPNGWSFGVPADASHELRDPSVGVSLSASGFDTNLNGSTYSSPPNLTISGGGGGGATANVSTSGIVTLGNPGSGYTSAPTVTVSGGTLTGGPGMTATYSADNVQGVSAAFTNELALHLAPTFQIIFLACRCGQALVGQVAQGLAKATAPNVLTGSVCGYTHYLHTSKDDQGVWTSWLSNDKDVPVASPKKQKDNKIVEFEATSPVTIPKK